MKTNFTELLQNSIYFTVFTVFITISFLNGCTGSDGEEEFQRALEYRQKDDIRAASIELKNVLRENPTHAEARYLLGQISLEIGDAATAEKELLRAKEAGWDEAAVQLLLAEAIFRQGKFQKLVDDISILDSYPADVKANLLGLRAAAQAGLGEWEEVAATLISGEAIDSNALWVLQSRARLQINSEDLKAAGVTLTRALEKYPDSRDLWLLNAAILEEKGDLAAANDAYQQVTKLDPPKLITAWGRQARLGQSRIQLIQKNNEKAMEVLDPVLKMYPSDLEANYLGSVIASELKQYDLAEKRVLKVLKLAPEHYASLLLIGNLYYMQEDYEQAAYYLEKATYARPENLQAQTLLGKTYLLLGQYNEAEDTFEFASSRTGDNAELLALIGIAKMKGGDARAGIQNLENAAETAPADTAVISELAKAYMNTGETARAIEVLESVIEESDQKLQTETLLILAYLRAGENDKAIDLAHKLSNQLPDNPLPHVFTGMALEMKKEFTTARSNYDKALNIQSDNILAILGHARIDMQEGKTESSRKRYQTVLTIQPDNSVALTSLAYILASEGKDEESVKLLEKAREADPAALESRLLLSNFYIHQGDAGKALVYAMEAQKINPENVRVLFVLGKAQLGTADPEAEQTFLTLVKRVPESPDAHFYLALAQARSGDVDAIRQSLQRVLELNPDHVEARLALGNLELHDGNTDTAMEIAHQLQQTKPDSVAGYLLEGDVLMARQDTKQALPAYQAALKRTQNGEVVIRINRAQRLLGNKKAGYGALSEWLKKHPEDLQVRFTLALTHMADGENDAAMSQFRKILEKQPDNAAVLNDLAWLTHESGEPGAVEMAERAHRLAPDNPAIQDTYGWLLVQTGSVESGLIALEQAAKKAPDIYDIRYHLAYALAKAGNKTRAKQELDSILESGKPFSERDKAEVLLKEL